MTWCPILARGIDWLARPAADVYDLRRPPRHVPRKLPVEHMGPDPASEAPVMDVDELVSKVGPLVHHSTSP